MNIKYRSRAAELENDETTKRIFLHPSECHIRRTLCENFRESCLDDFHDTVRKHGFIDDFQVSTITMGNTHAVFVW